MLKIVRNYSQDVRNCTNYLHIRERQFFIRRVKKTITCLFYCYYIFFIIKAMYKNSTHEYYRILS
jgi:hypothetical protein